MRGFEFGAEAGGVQALVVALVAQVAEVEFGGALVGLGVVLQAGTAFLGAVVEDELVIGTAALLALADGLAFDAAQAGGVGVAGCAPGNQALWPPMAAPAPLVTWLCWASAWPLPL